MKLVVQVKLLPTEAQADSLVATIRKANEACDWLSERAWELRVFKQFDLHKIAYREARAAFPELSSQMVIRCNAKVADAYKLDHETKRAFRPLGSIAYDARLLSWKDSTVSLWALGGRMKKIPFVCGERQKALLAYDRGESDLIYRKGKLFLFVTVDVPDGTPIDPKGWLGVDLGIKNLAVDSLKEFHSGEKVEEIRQRYTGHRQRLQARGTRSARRRLKKIAGREARFRTIENHRISNRIIQKAKDTGRGIALEILKGIRQRVTVRKGQRAQHAGWAFFQLMSFIVYKALLAGVRIIFVDPRDTSRTCLECRHVDKRNRKSQSEFLCIKCGFEEHADVVGAVNIEIRAAINQPIVAGVDGVVSPGVQLQKFEVAFARTQPQGLPL